MKRQNIAQLMAVSFVALCTGFVLGLQIGVPHVHNMTQGKEYKYGFELIDDIDTNYALESRRQPVADRTSTLIAYQAGLQEHGSAERTEFNHVVEVDELITVVAQTRTSPQGTLVTLETQGVDLATSDYAALVFINNREYSTSLDGSDVVLPQDFSGEIKVELIDMKNRVLISDGKPVEAFAYILEK